MLHPVKRYFCQDRPLAKFNNRRKFVKAMRNVCVDKIRSRAKCAKTGYKIWIQRLGIRRPEPASMDPAVFLPTITPRHFPQTSTSTYKCHVFFFNVTRLSSFWGKPRLKKKKNRKTITSTHQKMYVPKSWGMKRLRNPPVVVSRKWPGGLGG